MRGDVRGGDRLPGGMTGYPLDQLHKEVAFIAYYFHWGYEDVMNMPHEQRRRWCEEISDINKTLGKENGD